MRRVRSRILRDSCVAGISLTAFLLCAGVLQPGRAEAAAPGALYFSEQGTGFARAFCPGGAAVLGGGGLVEQPSGVFQEERLRQSFPISDKTGVLAFGSTAIGWQAASSDFEDTVVAFVVCAGPALRSAIVAMNYASVQTEVPDGSARAFCPAGFTVTGGGGLIETPLGQPFEEQSLRYSYPISDATGVPAFGTTAIGWQAATSDFDVVAPFDIVVTFAVCAQFVPGVVVEYLLDFADGSARAFCPSGTMLTGGGVQPDENTIVRQSYPISDSSGAIARGRRAIGWQGASSGFEGQVQAYAICASM